MKESTSIPQLVFRLGSALLATLLFGCSSDSPGPDAPPADEDPQAWTEDRINSADFTLRDIWMSPEGVGFAVGYRGSLNSPSAVILTYDGSEWTSFEPGVAQPLKAVSGMSATDVHAVGGGGLALHYDGSGWQEQDTQGTANLGHVSAGASDFAIATDGGDKVLRWNGTMWIPVEVTSEVNFGGVWAQSSDQAILTTDVGVFTADRDGNLNPLILTTKDLWELHGNSAGRIFVRGQDELWELVGGILDHNISFVPYDVDHFTDIMVAANGDVFLGVGEPDLGAFHYIPDSGIVHQMSLPPQPWGRLSNAKYLSGRSATDLIAVSYNGPVSFDGQTWKAMRVEPAQAVPALNAVFGNSQGRTWASRLDGGFYVCDGDGVWSGPATVSSVTGSNPIWANETVVVRARPCTGHGCTGSFLSVWEQEAGPYDFHDDHSTDVTIHALWGTDEDNVFAVGSDARILRYTGGAWTEMPDIPIEATGTLRAIFGTSASEIYAAGDSGTFLRFDGAGWNEMNIEASVDLRDVWVDAFSGAVYTVGVEATVLLHDGAAWIPMAVPDGITGDLNALWGFGEDDVYALGEGGLAMHYDGASWELVDIGATGTINDAWGSSSCEIIAVCEDGRILRGGHK